MTRQELDAFIPFALKTLPPRTTSTQEARAVLIAEGIITADGELAAEFRQAAIPAQLSGYDLVSNRPQSVVRRRSSGSRHVLASSGRSGLSQRCRNYSTLSRIEARSPLPRKTINSPSSKQIAYRKVRGKRRVYFGRTGEGPGGNLM